MFNTLKNLFLRNAVVPAIVGLLAAKLQEAWSRNHKAIHTALPNALDWFEARTGINIPDAQEATAVTWYLRLVSVIDRAVSSQSLVRKVVKYLMDTKNIAQRDDLIKEIQSLGLYDLFMANFSPSLKAIVNEVKHQEAFRVARGLVPNSVPDSAIHANIVKACKVNSPLLHSGEEVTPELLNKLIAESKARKENLKK